MNVKMPRLPRSNSLITHVMWPEKKAAWPIRVADSVRLALRKTGEWLEDPCDSVHEATTAGFVAFLLGWCVLWISIVVFTYAPEIAAFLAGIGVTW